MSLPESPFCPFHTALKNKDIKAFSSALRLYTDFDFSTYATLLQKTVAIAALDDDRRFLRIILRPKFVETYANPKVFREDKLASSVFIDQVALLASNRRIGAVNVFLKAFNLNPGHAIHRIYENAFAFPMPVKAVETLIEVLKIRKEPFVKLKRMEDCQFSFLGTPETLPSPRDLERLTRLRGIIDCTLEMGDFPPIGERPKRRPRHRTPPPLPACSKLVANLTSSDDLPLSSRERKEVKLLQRRFQSLRGFFIPQKTLA